MRPEIFSGQAGMRSITFSNLQVAVCNAYSDKSSQTCELLDEQHADDVACMRIRRAAAESCLTETVYSEFIDKARAANIGDGEGLSFPFLSLPGSTDVAD